MFSGQSLWFNVLIQPDENEKRRVDFCPRRFYYRFKN